MKKTISFLCLVVCTFIWGTTFVAQDSGMDNMGVEASMAVLKKMSRERNRNVFLISHKDELQSRVTDILQVVKENGFTTYETTKDFVLE